MSTKILKRTIVLLLCCCLLHATSISQGGSAPQGDTQAINKPVKVDSPGKKPVAKEPVVKPTNDSLANKDATCIKCNVDPAKLGVRWWLVFMPVILFFIVGGFFITLILRGNFDLATTLSTGKSEASPPDDANAATATDTKPVGSTSRLIAFLTGITAILIAICLITYYAYFTLAECCGTPKFDELWKILAGLGIGIVPYGINVWRGNSKEKDNSDN